MNKITKAKEYAFEKHWGKVDDEGRPQFEHVEAVANILSQVTHDEDIIAAGYLHDVIEDCGIMGEELRQEFGLRIALLVEAVTQEGEKDEKGYYFPRLTPDNPYYQQAVMIKFSDRLSNLSRMESWDHDRRAHYLKKSKFWRTE